MKQLLKNILLISLLGLFLGCDKYEVTPRAYPRITTLPVTEITTEGARFNAEIIFRGDMEIINSGFVWGRFPNPVKEKNDKWVSYDNIQNDKFSQLIETNLKKDINYNVRAFIETNDFIVYGWNVEFLSLGSRTPNSGRFAPEFGILKDTINIYGEEFSLVKSNNKVRFGNTISKVISSSSSLLQVIVPAELTEKKTLITVEIGRETLSFNQEFTLLEPKIINILDTEVEYCDSVRIMVSNFPLNTLVKVHFLDQFTTAIRTGKDEIIAMIPHFLRDRGAINPTVEVANFNLSSNQELFIKNPEIELVSDSFLSFHDTLTILHSNLENCDLDVLIENKIISFISEEKNEIKIRIPANIVNPRKIPIKVKSEGEILFNEQLERRVVTNSISPSSAKPGEHVRLDGRGYQPIKNGNTIYFAPNEACLSNSECRIRCEIIESSGRHIVFKIPNNVKDFTDVDGNAFLGIIAQHISNSPLIRYRIIL